MNTDWVYLRNRIREAGDGRSRLFIGLFLLICTLLASGGGRAEADAAAPASFGYGFNVATWDLARVQGMGFNWIKLFAPPGERLPVQVLQRVDAHAGHLDNLAAFGASVAGLARNHAPYVDAYEIGNEPNLDADFGWGAPPAAADYARLLCEAYGRIKAHDPSAIVVSAGLAPTGRVTGNWEGHAGHNGRYQDEREFLREFLAAGGAGCLDAVGYHPYGFSADYDAAPDAANADPARNCTNGFCFRGVERIHAILAENGLGAVPVWATEFGWIVTPPAECLNDPGWQGRQWQIVSEQKQAENLAGAFAYATANWPWMGAMFIFNLNFNQVDWYQACEQMRYYAVAGRPAETALRDLPKVHDAPRYALHVSPAAITLFEAQAAQPFSRARGLTLRNTGNAALAYRVTAVAGALSPALSNGEGTLEPGMETAVGVLIDSAGRAPGVYSAVMRVTTDPQTPEGQLEIPVTLRILETVHRAHLPIVRAPGR